MPLLERLRYLCISCTNLDEFFEVRVAVLKQHSRARRAAARRRRARPSDVLGRIRDRALTLVNAQYEFWNASLLPRARARRRALLQARHAGRSSRSAGCKATSATSACRCSRRSGSILRIRFRASSTRASISRSCSKGRDAFGREGHMALLRAPRSLPRIIRLPAEVAEAPYDFVFLSSILHEFMDELFPGMEVKGSYQFRVTRNSELFVDEEEVENLALALRDELKGRGYAKPVRLEVADNCPKSVADLLVAELPARTSRTCSAATARSTSAASRRSTTRSTAPISSSRCSCRACCPRSPKSTICST